jgi:hypothetical protein
MNESCPARLGARVLLAAQPRSRAAAGSTGARSPAGVSSAKIIASVGARPMVYSALMGPNAPRPVRRHLFFFLI